MDEFPVLGLGHPLVQFFQFIAVLFSKKMEGHLRNRDPSADGQDPFESINGINQTVSELRNELQRTVKSIKATFNSKQGRLTGEKGAALLPLASSCASDCDRLLSILEELKKMDTSTRLSFVVALNELKNWASLMGMEGRTRTGPFITQLCSGFSQAIKQVVSQFVELGEITTRSGPVEEAVRQLDEMMARIDEIQVSKNVMSIGSGELGELHVNIKQLSLRGYTYAREHELFQSINFDGRSERLANIAAAHQDTFRWAFQANSTGNEEEGRLLSWLREGSGIFWVSGKPGSGKSTFMKCVAEHNETSVALGSWAGNNKVVTASHSSWYAGSEMQRSLEGLLRSLLFNILRQVPDLIPVTCPQRWKYYSEDMTRSLKADPKPWTLAELQAAITLVSRPENLTMNFCFFIDGLDEFAGDHSLTCEVLTTLFRSSNVKLCISARPWSVFEKHFGQDSSKKLCLHELTHDDIRSYLEASVSKHERWPALQSEDENEGSKQLVDEIADRSEGVFLWAHQMAETVLECLASNESLSNLRRRVESSPSGLEALYRYKMESVEPCNREKMAGNLQIAMVANEPLPVAIYRLHDLEYENRQYALNETTQPWAPKKIEEVRHLVIRRLRERCKGLLVVNGSNVHLLHRTVFEFLLTEEMRTFLSRTVRKGFDAHFSIFQAYVAWIKHADFYRQGQKTGTALLAETLQKALSHASQAKPRDDSPDNDGVDIFNDLKISLQSILRGSTFVHWTIVPKIANGLIRSCTPQAGLGPNIEKGTQGNTPSHNVPHSQTLAGLLCPKNGENVDWTAERVESLQVLLRHGANPNSRQFGPWKSFTGRILPFLSMTTEPDKTEEPDETGDTNPTDKVQRQPKLRFYKDGPEELVQVLEHGILQSLLESNADPNAPIGSGRDGWTIPVWARLLIAGVFSLPQLEETIEEYVETLEAMLARADFATVEYGLEDLCELFVPKPEFAGVVQRQARGSMLALIYIHLDMILAQEVMVSGYTGRKLKAKAISAFIKKAHHPSTPMHILEWRMRRAFPDHGK